jgi:hypothetical protein
MNKVHLRIIYGADERYPLVRNTILTHYKYFDSVLIWNSGPDENAKVFDNLLSCVPNAKVFNYGRYYHMTNPEDATRAFTVDIPDGEWLLYLDSDWRLPESFLINMRKEIDIMEKENFNHLFSSQFSHHIGSITNDWESTKINYTQEQLIEMAKSTSIDSYGQPILQRVDKKNIWCDSFIGNHGYMLHIPYNKKHIKYMYHFHIKDYGDHSICSSVIPLAWWYIGHIGNHFSTEDQMYIQNSWEYKALEQFKSDHKCYTSNQLFEKLKSTDQSFTSDLKSLFLLFEKSTIYPCQQMYKMAVEFNMKFLETFEETKCNCNGICCLYDGKYIKDYPKI